ncbi:MAG: HDOD domain-containing protein [Paucibacter sp.]|nr:HDOD domain-containing protein [Roseateles sp.]
MKASAIRQEVDNSRKSGSLKQIKIPPCPEALALLQDAMNRPEPDLTAVARIAADDVAMSATLLRTANGPLYRPLGPPCSTVGQAMTRLGLTESALLMTSFLASNAIPVTHPRLQRFWQRAAKRAAACRFLAEQLAGMSRDVAHLYGLFLHVGIPVLLQSVRGYGATLVEAEARIDRPFIATENANHRTDHAVVGALVARVWNMPPELMAAVRLHHDFSVLGASDVEPEVQTLVALGLLAEHLMRRHEGLDDDADWAAHHARALDWLQIGIDDLDQWEEASCAWLDEAG